MTKLTRQKIEEKIKNFQEYLNYLYKIKEEVKSEKEFVNDFHLFGSAERYFQLTIQAIIDILHLIIIDAKIERPQDNYESISALVHEEIISKKLANKLTKMIGLRNILVHEYGKINRQELYIALKNQLEDLEEFKKQIKDYLN